MRDDLIGVPQIQKRQRRYQKCLNPASPVWLPDRTDPASLKQFQAPIL